MWDLTRPAIKPASFALQGRFLTIYLCQHLAVVLSESKHLLGLTRWLSGKKKKQKKNLPNTQEMREMWVQSPDREDPLEEGMATHSSTVARKNPVDKEHGQSPWSCEKSDMSEATGHTSIFLVYLRAMLISISVNSVHILGLFFYRILAFVF